jgi:hypothetical protein
LLSSCCPFVPKRAFTFVVCFHPVCAARVDWVLVVVFFSHRFLRCCCCLFFVNFRAVRGQASLGEPRRRFFDWFSSSRLVSGFSSLGVALAHGSRRAVSPHFLHRRPSVPRCLFFGPASRAARRQAESRRQSVSRFSVCPDIVKRAPAPLGALDSAARSRVLRPRARRLRVGLSPRRVAA